MAAPTVFVMYSWDGDDHQSWVLSLVDQLRHYGVDAMVDRSGLRPGEDLTLFMRRMVRECDHLVAVCTPSYAQRADAHQGGVGWETRTIESDVQAGRIKLSKVIPILRAGDKASALPSYLSSSLFIDFRDDAKFGAALADLLRHLHGHAQVDAAPLGPRPAFAARAIASPVAIPGLAGVGGPVSTKPADESIWLRLTPSLFLEDFDGTRESIVERFGAWMFHDEGDVRGELVDGEYRLTSTRPPGSVRYQWMELTNPAGESIDITNAPISVQVKVVKAGVPGSAAGLCYRFEKETGTYLAVVVTASGTCKIWRRSSTGFEQLHAGGCPDFRPGGFNTIGVMGAGRFVDAFVNHRLIRRFDAGPLLTGGTGFVTFDPGEYAFDNFAVYEGA